MLFLFYLERLAGDCVKVALGVVGQNAIPRKAFEAKNNLEAFLDKNVPGIIESVWKKYPFFSKMNQILETFSFSRSLNLDDGNITVLRGFFFFLFRTKNNIRYNSKSTAIYYI